MNFSGTKPFRLVEKQELFLLVSILIVAWYYAYIIVTRPFPESLPFLFWLPMLIVIIFNIRFGIILWYILSSLGNIFLVDFPGIPPLHVTQLILLLLLGGWFVTSYKEIPQAIGRFLGTRKNRIFMLLFGWITLSMIMGRVTGVTQMSFKYQFNGWLSVLFVMITALFLFYHFSEHLLKGMIWIIVCIKTFLHAATLVTGILKGVGLFEWQKFIGEFYSNYGFSGIPSLFLALIFFPQQKLWGKLFLSIAIIFSLANVILLILGGHRSTTLWLISTMGFILLFIRTRFIVVFSIVVLMFFILINVPATRSWINEQSRYTFTSQSVVYGPGSRIALARDAVQIIKRHPIWGTGTDYYRLHSDLWVGYPGGRTDRVPTPHNSWLQVAVDHGLPVLALLIIFCGYVFRDCILLFRSLNNQFLKMFVLFFSASFGARIVDSFIGSGQIIPVFTGKGGDETLALRGVLISFWFLYGLLLGIENKEIERDSTVATSRAGH